MGTGGTTPLPLPDASGTIAMSGTAGKVALVSGTAALSGTCPTAGVVDFVGFGATANCFEGPGPTPAPSNTLSVSRVGNSCTETDNNAADFSTGAPNPRNTISPTSPCTGTTNPSGTGLASPSSVLPGASSLLTVNVTPGSSPVSTGLAVAADLSAIGGSATQAFSDDGTGADVTPNDNIFSFGATVSATTAPGLKSLPVTITDAQARVGSTSISLTVASPPPVTVRINEIQGAGSTSPYAGSNVATRGIVTALRSNGFFMQSLGADDDGAPETSEGLFVFTSAAPTVAVGADVTVTGPVVEFAPNADPFQLPLTEISVPTTVTVNSNGNPLPPPVTLTAAMLLPNAGPDKRANLEQLERFEDMRVTVPSLTVIAPTQGFVNEPNATSTSSGVFYAVITGTPRPIREAGIELLTPLPSETPATVPLFDENPERLRVDSDAQIGAAVLDVAHGQEITGMVGVLGYDFRDVHDLPGPGGANRRQRQRDGHAGARARRADIHRRLVQHATVLRHGERSDRGRRRADPDGVQQPVEQGLARHSRRAADAGHPRRAGNGQHQRADGAGHKRSTTTPWPPASRIRATSPYLVEGNDIGGIDVGFLVKSTVVSVLNVTQEGADATYVNPTTLANDLLNDRPPLVLQAIVQKPGSSAKPITVINNHMRSLNGVDTNDADGRRVRAKRRAQAEFLANLVQARQLADSRPRRFSSSATSTRSTSTTATWTASRRSKARRRRRAW